MTQKSKARLSSLLMQVHAYKSTGFALAALNTPFHSQLNSVLSPGQLNNASFSLENGKAPQLCVWNLQLCALCFFLFPTIK